MHITTTIQKWGNGLALRISGSLREIPDFKEGTPVDVEISKKGFTVKKAIVKKKKRLVYSETQLLKGLTSHKAHADELPSLLPQESDF